MLKSLSFIRYMFSAAKGKPKANSALPPRVRNIPKCYFLSADKYCIATSIYQKGQQALNIAINKNGDKP